MLCLPFSIAGVSEGQGQHSQLQQVVWGVGSEEWGGGNLCACATSGQSHGMLPGQDPGPTLLPAAASEGQGF